MMFQAAVKVLALMAILAFLVVTLGVWVMLNLT
jgi:hypothetical protein